MSNIVFCLSSTVFTPMPVTVYNLFRDYYNLGRGSGLMVSTLYPGVNSPGSSPGWGHFLLCSWARHFTLTVPLSTPVYKWIPENLMLGVTLRWTSGE